MGGVTSADYGLWHVYDEPGVGRLPSENGAGSVVDLYGSGGVKQPGAGGKRLSGRRDGGLWGPSHDGDSPMHEKDRRTVYRET